MQRSNGRHSEGTNRRNFLKLAGAAVVGGAIGVTTACQSPTKTGPPIGTDLSDSGFWKNVQNQFALDPKQIYMNIGTTGAMPRKVVENYHQYNKMAARHPMGFKDELGWDLGLSKQREQLSRQFGCTTDEIILSRNTTDGLNTVLFGLPFEKGDEILLTHHEHFSALSPLNILRDRFGVVLTEAEIPVLDLEHTDQVVSALEKRITNRTRALVFSHIPYTTGVRLPAKALCRLARDHGLISIVDGAHCAGMIDLDFHDMGCDFYAASGHKWQCGPGATGILYMRNHGRDLPKIWPLNTCLYQMTAQPLDNDRTRIEDISLVFGDRGRENYPALQALLDACNLWEEIGRDRIEARVCSLSSYLKTRIRETFGDNAMFFSPDILEFTSGLTSFNPFPDRNDRDKIKEFVRCLKEEMGYVIRSTEFYLQKRDPKATFALRISTHLFHDRTQVDGVVEAMHKVWKTMVS